MSELAIESVPLHEHTHYADGCVEILCEEWGRSRAARISMLEKSNDNLPYNIAMLEKNVNNPQQVTVIGHSRLSRVYGQPEAAFVESVVIPKKRRNQGLGRKLMDATEEHARRLGITTLFLSTHDKQDFYSHLGYDYCNPVVSSGAASAFLTEKLSLLLGSGETYLPEISAIKLSPPKTTTPEKRAFNVVVDGNDSMETICQASNEIVIDCEDESQNFVMNSPPPPPPPPTPLANRAINCERKPVITRISVYWMKKELIFSTPN